MNFEEVEIFLRWKAMLYADVVAQKPNLFAMGPMRRLSSMVRKRHQGKNIGVERFYLKDLELICSTILGVLSPDSVTERKEMHGSLWKCPMMKNAEMRQLKLRASALLED